MSDGYVQLEHCDDWGVEYARVAGRWTMTNVRRQQVLPRGDVVRLMLDGQEARGVVVEASGTRTICDHGHDYQAAYTRRWLAGFGADGSPFRVRFETALVRLEDVKMPEHD